MKMIVKLLVSFVLVWGCKAQTTPSIGFISPDVITEIGNNKTLKIHYYINGIIMQIFIRHI